MRHRRHRYTLNVYLLGWRAQSCSCITWSLKNGVEFNQNRNVNVLWIQSFGKVFYVKVVFIHLSVSVYLSLNLIPEASSIIYAQRDNLEKVIWGCFPIRLRWCLKLFPDTADGIKIESWNLFCCLILHKTAPRLFSSHSLHLCCCERPKNCAEPEKG